MNNTPANPAANVPPPRDREPRGHQAVSPQTDEEREKELEEELKDEMAKDGAGGD
jgi:hypothetical protein